MNIGDLILNAHKRIHPFLTETPLEHSSALSELSGAEVHLKCEHLQHTGSFKLRGALSKLTHLQRQEGKSNLAVISASTGNHGLGVAYAAKQLNIKATVYLPEATFSSKQDAIRRLGANIVTVKGDGLQAEIEARNQAITSGDHRL